MECSLKPNGLPAPKFSFPLEEAPKGTLISRRGVDNTMVSTVSGISWSSTFSAIVLRIATDVLEGESQGLYYLNGVVGADLPSVFGGFEFLHAQPFDKLHVFKVHLGGRERIKVKNFKDFVSVLFEQSQQAHLQLRDYAEVPCAFWRNGSIDWPTD
jgi:hypothetical protein